jgi:two-component system, NtrC family, sensor kinase
MRSLKFRSKIYLAFGSVSLFGVLIILKILLFPHSPISMLDIVELTLLLAGLSLMAGVLGFYLNRSFQLPVRSLTYIARSISAGELNHKLSLDRGDEFGEMAEALNMMVVSLQNVNKDLTDQIRRFREAKSELAHTQNQLALQEHMMRQEKMAALGSLVAGVAHELNNPISFVYSNTVLLSESIANLRTLLDFYDSCEGMPDEIKKKSGRLKEEMDYDYLINDVSQAIDDCHEGSRRVRDIVLNLKTFSRADESQLGKVDITEGIESTTRMLSQFFQPGRVALHRDYAELPAIECYAGQLSQVWMNLMVNAAQAMNSQGDLFITTLSDNGYVVIKFRDSGPGITEDVITRIFDPFFTTKSVNEGTGLGLSIVHGIIERHGGDIKVESKPGVGTTFTVRLPVAGMASTKNRAGEPEGALV